MRNIRVMALVGTVATLAFVAIVASCGGGGGDSGPPPASPAAAANVIRSALLNGAQETPPVVTAAVGRGAVVVNTTTLEITGGITFSGLSGAATDAHIHEAATGVPGGVIIPLTIAPDGATAIVPTGSTLTAAQFTSLQAGNLYFNVHTGANPNGEIRGQLTATAGVTAGRATLSGSGEVPPNASTAIGRGTIVFDSTTREILVCYVTHNVTNATVAHIHTGAPGVSGPADVVTLNQGPNIYTCPVTTPRTALTATNVTNLTAGNTYFNVHSTNNLCPPAADCSNGEIRGQIAVVQ
jgi:hypothetical protein